MIHPLTLGSLTLPNNILYAPLAGCSDFPFRKMTARYNPGIVYCEMVKMDALVRNDPSTYHLLDYSPDMHPIGAQLCGSKPQYVRESAKIIEDLGFDVIDLNCGCPVDKVTKDGSGSGLLKTPHLIGEILTEMVDAVNIPVTVKIRTGWDDDSLVAPLVTQIAEAAGAKAITIHGRTRVQGYKGNADWSRIKECVDAANTIKVIGNGDVTSGPLAEKLFVETGCDAILISRATMGTPWIVQDVLHHFEGLPPLNLSHKQIMLDHLEYIRDYEDDRGAVIAMRRVGCWYLRKGKGTKALRETINRAQKLSEIETLIENYNWDGVSYDSI